MKKITFITLLALFCIPMMHAALINLADPTVFYDNGTYYLTGTLNSNGFTMYKSTDLLHWTTCGNATNGLALYKDDVYGTASFWAPQIFLYEDSYYMAYVANEQIAIAKSDSPMGPFTMENKECLNGTTGQIDPFVFFDDDGKIYIYYVRFINGNSLYVGELSDDFTSIDENTITHCLTAKSGTWEMTASEQVVEGPTVIKDGGYYYLLYSANDYTNIDYAVGYAYSTSPTGPWTRKENPILSRHNVGINGTGHGDLFQDGDGNWYYVFHVHASNSAVQTRRTAIVPITLTDDPENKFIPDVDRTIILDTSLADDATFPTSKETFEIDGVMYKVSDEETKKVEIAPLDNIHFGGYEGYITIPETVTHNEETYTVVGVGTGAFYDTPYLERLSLPSTATTIGIGAIESSGLWCLEIHSTTIEFDYNALLKNSSLLDIIIDNPIAPSISNDYISSTTLLDGKLWVPTGSEESYQSASVWKEFRRVSGVEETSPQYDFYVDGLYYTIVDEEDATCEVAMQSKLYATYGEKDIVIPRYVTCNKEYTIIGIGAAGLRDCRLVEKVEIPEGIDYIDSYALYGMYSLTEITLPASLGTIGDYAFRSSPALTSITCLAKTPPTIKKAAFATEAFDGVLYVPYGTGSLYAEAIEWKKFNNIVELGYDGIETMYTTPRRNDDATYNLSGMRVNNGYKGIILRNGKKYIK